MIIYFWNKCQKMPNQLINVLNEAEYCYNIADAMML